MQKKPLSGSKLFLLLAFGLIAFLVYFILFVDLPTFVETISQINLVLYGASFVVYLIGVFFSSMVWRSLLNALTVKITVKNAYLFTWVGLFFDATIPQLGLSGDVAKTYLFSKSSNEDAGKIGASVIGQKIIVMTLTVVTFGIGLVLVLFNRILEPLVTFSIILFLILSGISLFLIYYLSVKPKATHALLQFVTRVGLFFRKKWDSTAFNQKVTEVIDNFHISISELKSKPRVLGVSSIYSILSWFFDIGVMFLVFAALGYPIPFDSVLIVYTISGVLQAVGIGVFGINEIVMISIFRALGLPDGLSVSVTLLSRAVMLWFRLIVSYGAFQWTSIKLARQTQQHLPPKTL
ncbi:MAG: flippase-like domain-containing protein [Candidatus Bathyarchaeota archaeon]|nr:flippase-like domain-containing protein [Candidatus Termiticorpusculum sp.]